LAARRQRRHADSPRPMIWRRSAKIFRDSEPSSATSTRCLSASAVSTRARSRGRSTSSRTSRGAQKSISDKVPSKSRRPTNARFSSTFVSVRTGRRVPTRPYSRS
jgi:hypothetical protein